MLTSKRDFIRMLLAGTLAPAMTPKAAAKTTPKATPKMTLAQTHVDGVTQHSVSNIVAGYKRADGKYGVGSVGGDGSLGWTSDLPARVHDCVFNPIKQEVIAFSRRPGHYFWPLSLQTGLVLKTVEATQGRHFYGHGCFSADGQFLYVTENNYESAQGVIGIYNTTDYVRIGEIPTYGVGPHDIALVNNGGALIVANGGIETHPSTGREKLNIPFMESTISIIDLPDGALIRQFTLPPKLQKLSIRHLARSSDKVFFACQYEGAIEDQPPLLGSVSTGGDFTIWPIKDKDSIRLKNYISSVAVSADGNHLVTTSSKGGIALVWDVNTTQTVRAFEIEDCSGAGTTGSKIHLSSGYGDLMLNQSIANPADKSINRIPNMHWDNHMVAR